MDVLTPERLAEILEEADVRAIRRLRQVLRILGRGRTTAVLVETLHREASGGMLTRDGTRRRPPGGTFFQLVKEQATAEERRRLFYRRATQKVVYL
jgi:hypothetical protein